MEHQITTTTITTTEIATTDIAQYQCTVKFVDGKLQSVSAYVNSRLSEDTLELVGTILYNQSGKISFGNDGFSMSEQTSVYLAEFTELVETIKARE